MKNTEKDSVVITIYADCEQAKQALKELRSEIKKLTNELRPKWWQFWKWFNRIVINVADPIKVDNEIK